MYAHVLFCLLACLPGFSSDTTDFSPSPGCHVIVTTFLLFPLTLLEAAQIAGKKACERMKDAIRRGVERQVAEGMFERAQERMWHQFRQLKVFYICAGKSSPGEKKWRTGTGQMVDSWAN